jgi:hypothetical protein
VTNRYGQLSYTSFDTAGSAGGWQVKETNGALTADETRLLVAHVQTVFAPPQPLPQYPTPEQVAALPRRLAYRRTGGNAAAYWHSVPAGADATGRPGNVFTHVLYDRVAAEATPAFRPIQLWRSERWLCPYGKAAVAAAELPHDPPGPGTAVTADSVIEFALDTRTWRLGVLFGLLDAVAAALDGGPGVLLGVESADAAAQWIGLISFLMSAGTARALSFSTFDRAEQLGPVPGAGQQLTAVPREDLDRAPAGVLAIDETEMLSLGEFGGEPHRTAAGQPIDATAWSAMAQVALLDRASARLLLADIDAFAAQVTDNGLHPAWPMALSVISRPEFADAAREARSVIATQSPSDLPAHSVPARVVRDVVTVLAGSSTADAWRILQQMPDGLAGDTATALYLRRAIADGAWLDQPGPISLAGRGFKDRPVPVELQAAIGPALSAARAASPDRLLQVVDLLLRAGLGDGLAQAIEADVAPTVFDSTQGPRLARRLGRRIDPRTRLAVAKAVMHRLYECPDLSLSDAVLEWLSDGLATPRATQAAAAQRWDDTWVAAALAGAHAAQCGAVTEAERSAGLWWLRITGAPLAELNRMAGRQAWDPAELLAAAGDAALRMGATVRTLLAAPSSSALLDLASLAAVDKHNTMMVACAKLRLIEPDEWVTQGYVESHHEIYSRCWDVAVGVVGLDGVHRDVVVRLLVLAAVAAVDGLSYAPGVAALGSDAKVRADALVQLVGLVDGVVLKPTEVAAAGLLRLISGADDDSSGGDPVDALLRTAAQQLGRTRPWAGDEIDAVAELMAAKSGASKDGDQRRFRKVAQKTLTGPSEGQPSLAARFRRSR